MNNLKLITSGQRFAFCMVSCSPLRKDANDGSEMISQLLFGEPLNILQVQDNWIQIETYFDGYSGWMDRKHVLAISEKEMRKWLAELQYAPISSTTITTPWGKQALLPASFIGDTAFQIGPFSFNVSFPTNETIKSAFQTAMGYLNAPYLWGGKSVLGIDCSGLVQSVFRLHGINLPRDAYQQAEIGIEISYENAHNDDVAFFSNAQGKIIHVGILDHEFSIIHASGRVRIDKLITDGIWNDDFEKLTHSLVSIKRFY
jgi:hypothetical protein